MGYTSMLSYFLPLYLNSVFVAFSSADFHFFVHISVGLRIHRQIQQKSIRIIRTLRAKSEAFAIYDSLSLLFF